MRYAGRGWYKRNAPLPHRVIEIALIKAFLEMGDQVFLAWLSEGQPVDAKAALEAEKLSVLAAEGQHRHATLDAGAAVGLADPVRDEVVGFRRPFYRSAPEELLPGVAAAPVLAQACETERAGHVLADGVPLVPVDPPFELLLDRVGLKNARRLGLRMNVNRRPTMDELKAVFAGRGVIGIELDEAPR